MDPSSLEHSFQQPGAKPEYCKDEAAELLFPTADAYDWVPGRGKGGQALHLKSGALRVKSLPLPVPGAVSIWVKPESPVSKGYRRYFSSTFVSSGYIFCQEQNGS